MNKQLSGIPLLIALMVMFTACSKDIDDNPLNGRTSALFNPYVAYGTMTDQEGNIYKTVKIGTQTWMAENLRTTTYNDGTNIPKITNGNEWTKTLAGAYCTYNNTTNLDTIATYGRLYRWGAMKSGKLAPKGWHIPSDAEWTTLIDYVGGENVAGLKLKESASPHWIYVGINTRSTNETGFTALPGGTIFNTYSLIGNFGFWWSSSENSRYMIAGDSRVYKTVSNKGGMSVRCVKD